MNAIFCVMAAGIVAFAVVELLEYWRRYQTRKNRAATR
jgi:hypothetical protein